jgi:hypothetical protein
LKKYNFTSKKQLPVPAVAVSKPWAMSCVLTSSHTSSLRAQYTIVEKKINNENTTAGTGSGCEQAKGHEL